jgi:hypothetical protein
MFRHSYIFVNDSAAINGPDSLAGRRIEVQECHQAAGVWTRGFLAESYGDDFSGVSWLEG